MPTFKSKPKLKEKLTSVADDSWISPEFKTEWPRSGQCHYVIGNERKEWRWCGKKAKARSAYCTMHHKICYQKSK